MTHKLPVSRPLGVGLVLLLGGLAALGMLSTNIILPSFPTIGQEFDISDQTLGLTLSLFFALFALGQLVAGPLSDRFGRRNPVIIGLVLFVVGSIVCALATDFTLLLIGRILQAVGGCVAAVLSRAIARDMFDGNDLARVMSLVMVATATAPGFSPLLGGLFAQSYGWRSAFMFVAITGVAITLLYAFLLRETHPASRRNLINPRTVIQSYIQLVRHPHFIRPAASSVLLMASLFGLFAASPAILIGEVGLTSLQLGQFFAGTVFIVLAAGLSAPKLSTRFGPAAIARIGFLLAFVGGGLLFGLYATHHASLVTIAFAASVFLLGMGLGNPLCSAISLSPFGAHAGLASALLGFLQMAGAAIGAALCLRLLPNPVASLAMLWMLTSFLALIVFPAPPFKEKIAS